VDHRESTRAERFMKVYEAVKSDTVSDLPIDVSTLYLIAAPKTPEPVRQEIIKRAANDLDGR